MINNFESISTVDLRYLHSCISKLLLMRINFLQSLSNFGAKLELDDCVKPLMVICFVVYIVLYQAFADEN